MPPFSNWIYYCQERWLYFTIFLPERLRLLYRIINFLHVALARQLRHHRPERRRAHHNRTCHSHHLHASHYTTSQRLAVFPLPLCLALRSTDKKRTAHGLKTDGTRFGLRVGSWILVFWKQRAGEIATLRLYHKPRHPDTHRRKRGMIQSAAAMGRSIRSWKEA